MGDLRLVRSAKPREDEGLLTRTWESFAAAFAHSEKFPTPENFRVRELTFRAFSLLMCGRERP